MRTFDFRLTASLALACAVSMTPACKPRKSVRVELTDESAASLSASVHAADPQTAPQLVRGFYEVEQNSWRWTRREFAVVLQVPAGSASKGATLILKFAIPEAAFEKLGPITLSATVGGKPLPPETFSQPGTHIYSKPVPPAALSTNVVEVNFSLDKCLPPGAVDGRELGVIVSSIALESR